MMKLFFLIIVIFSTISQGFAKRPGVDMFCGKLIGGFGGTFISPDDMNFRLEKSGMPLIPGEYLQVGGGYQLIQSRIITEIEYFAILSRTERHGNFTSSFSGQYSYFNIGFLLLGLKNFQIYPLAGLGYGKIELRVTEEGDFSFDTFLDNPINLRSFERDIFTGNIALGFDFLIRDNGKSSNTGLGFVFGVRAGFTYDISVGEWKANELQLGASPYMGLTGFYVRVVMGIWE
jgi:hypothetical protein